MSKRIRSSNVQLGESLIIGQPLRLNTAGTFEDGELSKEDLYANLKEKEFKEKLDGLLIIAQEKATAIIEEAKTKAAQITQASINETQKKEEELVVLKNNVLEEAHQQGITSGYDDGYKKAFKDVHEKVINLEAIADAAYKIKKEIILSAEKELLELSIVIAEKIIKQRLEIKPEMITEIIKAAIKELKDKEEIKIIVNPALKDQLYNFSDELKASIKEMKILKIIEDKTIHVNSAIIESPESRIDARLETQIAEITREIMKSFEEEPVTEALYKDTKPKKNDKKQL